MKTYDSTEVIDIVAMYNYLNKEMKQSGMSIQTRPRGLFIVIKDDEPIYEHEDICVIRAFYDGFMAALENSKK